MEPASVWQRTTAKPFLRLIFQKLEPKDLLNAGLVCRMWHTISLEDAIWSQHCLQAVPGLFSTPTVVSVCGGYRNIYIERHKLDRLNKQLALKQVPTLRFREITFYFDIIYNGKVVSSEAVHGDSLSHGVLGIGFSKDLENLVKLTAPRKFAEKVSRARKPIGHFELGRCTPLEELAIRCNVLRVDGNKPRFTTLLLPSQANHASEPAKGRFELCWLDPVECVRPLSRVLFPFFDFLVDVTMFARATEEDGRDLVCFERVELKFIQRKADEDSLLEDQNKLLMCIEAMHWTD